MDEGLVYDIAREDVNTIERLPNVNLVISRIWVNDIVTEFLSDMYNIE